jgi:hypothetical protein
MFLVLTQTQFLEVASLKMLGRNLQVLEVVSVEMLEENLQFLEWKIG